MIDISTHARRRWRARSDCPGLAPELAWDLGVPVDEDLDTLEDWDEGRYHRQSETLLLRRETTLVTVLDARGVSGLQETVHSQEATA